jgi:hypothetical protein
VSQDVVQEFSEGRRADRKSRRAPALALGCHRESPAGLGCDTSDLNDDRRHDGASYAPGEEPRRNQYSLILMPVDLLALKNMSAHRHPGSIAALSDMVVDQIVEMERPQHS